MDEPFRPRFDPSLPTTAAVTPTASAGDETTDEGPAGAHPAYSMVSADRRQKLMLELRLKTGNATALAYSYLVSVTLDPSQAIVMDFSGYEVILSGRNLGPLFAGLVAQRVAVIREIDDLYAEASRGPHEPVVTRITVAERS